MGRSSYTPLSIEEKKYAKLRHAFDNIVDSDKTFTVWAMDTLETALNREKAVNSDYPEIRFIGIKTGGCILEEKGMPETTSEVENIETMIDEKSEININVGDNSDNGGGCLIATAVYGSELTSQVQFLREIRDNTVLSTESGAAFMTGFNQLYYSFSPTIADMERENPMFQETIRTFITPMISTLSIMTLAEEGNDAQVLGLGISVIALNLGMYIATPAVALWQIKKRI